jgi:hypothetical protein
LPANLDFDLSNRISRLGEELRLLQNTHSVTETRPPLLVGAPNHGEIRPLPAAQQVEPACDPPTPPKIVPENFPALQSSAALPPTVNVTIGRIEVKGSKSNEPAPARRELRARVMSLEQYLQRRSAGGGR